MSTDKLQCQFNRFWAISDPVDRDKVSSNRHRSEVLHPAVDCEKKASQEDRAFEAPLTLKNLLIKLGILLQEASFQTGDILSQVSQTHDVIM